MSIPVEYDGILDDWDREVGEKKTFMYVLDEHWNTVSRYWNEEKTIRRYLRDYNQYILPRTNNKPLEEYTREDFDDTISFVRAEKQREGKVCHELTLAHMRLLIRRVMEAADSSGVCANCLWGTEYSLPENCNEDDLSRDELVKLRKSLTIHEEIAVKEHLLLDEKQASENFGLALMFCLGLRNNEACGADFVDIHPLECDPSIQTLWVYKSTEKGTNIQRFGGKTSNVSRIIPLPEDLQSLLARRRKYIEACLRQTAKKGSLSDQAFEEKLSDKINAMPICGLGPAFDERCSAPKLTAAGRNLLKQIKVEQEMLALIDRDIRKPGRTEEGIAEKDPTAYLFRRNLGTQLYLLGLEDSEIQYILGHEIEADDEERNHYRNEEKLYPIALKMRKRPIVNTIDEFEMRTVLERSNLAIRNIGRGQIQIPVTGGEHIFLIVKQREPYSAMHISFGKSGASGTMTYRSVPNTEPYGKTLSIMDAYHKRYQKALARKKKKELPDPAQS